MTFQAKCVLPPRVPVPAVDPPLAKLDPAFFVKTRLVDGLCRDIDVSSATGPDAIAGRILKNCHEALASLIARLTGRDETRRDPGRVRKARSAARKRSGPETTINIVTNKK